MYAMKRTITPYARLHNAIESYLQQLFAEQSEEIEVCCYPGPEDKLRGGYRIDHLVPYINGGNVLGYDVILRVGKDNSIKACYRRRPPVRLSEVSGDLWALLTNNWG